MKEPKNQIRSLIDEINKKHPTFASQIRAIAPTGEKADAPTTFEISVSSEDPYERWFGMEILGHAKGEVDLSWLNSGNAPLLLQHDHSQTIGVIDSAKIEDGRVTAVVRFGRGALAQEIKQDVEDGIRTNVSVGYRINEMKLVVEHENAPDEYRVTNWMPFEASSVSVPADMSVGTNRSTDGAAEPQIHIKKDNTMDKQKELAVSLGLSEDASLESIMEAQRALGHAEAKGAADAELKRQSEIRSLGDLQRGKVKDVDARVKAAIDGKKSIDGFRLEILDAYTDGETEVPTAGRALTKAEKRDMSKYSFCKAILGQASGKLDGLELELHQEGLKEAGKGMAVAGLSIPHSVLMSRDLDVSTEGADLVATGITGFIGLLRKKMLLQELGARMLTGLTGNVLIPKMTAGGAAAWEGENDAGSEQTQTFGQVAFSPKRVGLYTDISKQLLLQATPDVEAMVREDLAAAIATAMDWAGINGTGANDQPTGILATSGIGSVAGGTNGLAPAWSHIVDLETAVAVDNADIGALSYLTSAKVRGALKQTAKVSSTDSNMVWGDGAMPLNGYGCGVTNQVPDTLTKGTSSGVASAIIFGNFNDLIIAQFGGLDIVVDPYTLATTNLLRIVANTYADVGVRHAESFAAMKDALTA